MNGQKQKRKLQMPNAVRQKLIDLTQKEGMSVYKARKLLNIKYSTAK